MHESVPQGIKWILLPPDIRQWHENIPAVLHNAARDNASPPIGVATKVYFYRILRPIRPHNGYGSHTIVSLTFYRAFSFAKIPSVEFAQTFIAQLVYKTSQPVPNLKQVLETFPLIVPLSSY